jgi:hypothetical protein
VSKKVLSHPLSQELMTHSDPSTQFDKPKSSLFAFMGFKKGKNPVQKLVTFLRSKYAFRTSISRGDQLSIKLIGPSEEDMVEHEISVDEWGDGRSWPEMLETGLTGLSNFLAIDGIGRSDGGIQIDKKLRSVDTLEPIKYLSPIFKQAERQFRNLLIRRLQ